MGPVGMILSVHLKEAGLEVAICDLDKVKMNSLRSGGVELHGCIEKKEQFKTQFTSLAELETFRPDLIFLCIKTTHLPAALNELASLQLPETAYICAMNGIDVESMVSSVMGEDKTFRMVINFAGNLLAANQTQVTFFNPPNFIASMDDSRKEQAEDIASRLTAVSLST